MEESTGRLSLAIMLPHCLCQLCGHQAVEHVKKELPMALCLFSAQRQQLVKLGTAAAALCGYCPGTPALTAEGGNACCVVSRAWCNHACSWVGLSMLLVVQKIKTGKSPKLWKTM